MNRKPNLMFIEDGYARLTTVDPETGFRSEEVTTLPLRERRYIRIDDGRQYPQLCAGGYNRGNTLEYYSDAQLARDCKARLFRTRSGYEKAKAKFETIARFCSEIR